MINRKSFLKQAAQSSAFPPVVTFLTRDEKWDAFMAFIVIFCVLPVRYDFVMFDADALMLFILIGRLLL
jgi:hypothetical protein